MKKINVHHTTKKRPELKLPSKQPENQQLLHFFCCVRRGLTGQVKFCFVLFFHTCVNKGKKERGIVRVTRAVKRSNGIKYSFNRIIELLL